ncbi:TolB family protein [Streptomyces sp. NPDC002276]
MPTRPTRPTRTSSISVGAALLLALGAAAPALSARHAPRLQRISACARYVAFASAETNLVPGDRNGVADLFVRDLRTGRTARVAQGPIVDRSAFSADGRYLVFVTPAALSKGDTDGVADVYLRDLRAGRTERVSHGHAPTASAPRPTAPRADGASYGVSLSANGRYAAFSSSATNLVPGDTDGVADIFVKDLRTGTVRQLTPGADAPAYLVDLDADGGSAALASPATNLVPADINGVSDVSVDRLN